MKRRDYLLVGGIALVLRLIGIGLDPFWYDEAFTRWIARLPLDRLFGAVAGDVHPPTYYLLEWLIARVFGTSEFALRLPAAFFGVGAVLLIMELCRALNMQRRVVLVAGLITAFLPAALYYSQEARVYSLMSVFVLLMLIGAIRERWLWFALGAIGTVYSHNLGVLYVFGVGLAVLFFRWKTGRGLWRVIVALASVVVVWLPWAFQMIHQIQTLAAGFWTPPVGLSGIVQPVAQMTMGMRATDSIQLALIPAAFGMTGIGLISSRHWLKSRQGVLYLVALFGVPALATLISALWKPVYINRAFLASGLLCAPLWAYTWGNFRGWNKRLYAAVLIPALVLGGLSHYRPLHPRSTSREVGDVIQQLIQPGDVCYFLNVWSQIALEPYIPRCYSAIDPMANDLNQSLSPDAKIAFGFNQLPLPLSKEFKRAWIPIAVTFGTSEREIYFISRIKRYGRLYYTDSREMIEIWLIDLDKVRGIWI